MCRVLKSLIVFSLFLTSFVAYTQQADAIVGEWFTENEKSTVKIFKKGEHYFAKIIALKNPLNEKGKPKLDTNNPEASNHDKTLIGLVILNKLSYKSGKTWDDGTIYDPESGNTYSCKLTLKDNNNIEMRGYMGISLLGRSTEWKRKN